MKTEIYLKGIEKIELVYETPEYLSGFEASKLREMDLAFLDKELRQSGSSLEEKVSSGIIWRMGFPGMILDVKKLNLNSRSARLVVSPIHPHRADLAYKNDRTLLRNVAPLTVVALLKSRDGNFVLGVRGGNVAAGKIGLIPGGHVDYVFPLVRDPLETFFTEFEEELGYAFGNGNVQNLGLFTNRDTNGVNIMYSVQTNLTFSEISENWRRAKDRAEHSSLFKATYENIEELAQTGGLRFGQKVSSTTPFFQDCFNHYIDCVKKGVTNV